MSYVFDDFDCPQYLDFDVEFDDTDRSDFFIENTTCDAEAIEEKLLNEVPEKLESFTAENISATKSNHTFLSNGKLRQGLINVTDTEKSKRISKSLNDINDAVTKDLDKNKNFNVKTRRLKKRSVSACELMAKKITYPVTPNCLKRAQTKKKVIKTSEQLELEKISQLRRQLSDRLKYNKSVMRKVSLKQYPVVLKPVAPSIKPPPNFRNKKQPENLNNFVFNAKKNNINDSSQSCSNESGNIKAASKRTDVNLLQASHNMIDKGVNTEVKLTKLSRSVCNASTATCNVNLFKTPDPTFKAHTGLKFLENKKKTTVLQPFHFSMHSRDEDINSSVERVALNVARKIRHRLSRSWTCERDPTFNSIPNGIFPVLSERVSRSRSLLNADINKENAAVVPTDQNASSGNNNVATGARPKTFRNPLKPYDFSKLGIKSKDK